MSGKVRAGTRPYCRSLIEAGETNEQILLEAVHEKFPEKAAQFKIADVRGCLRNAGKLDWTKAAIGGFLVWAIASAWPIWGALRAGGM